MCVTSHGLKNTQGISNKQKSKQHPVNKTNYCVTIMVEQLVASNFAKDLDSAKRQTRIMFISRNCLLSFVTSWCSKKNVLIKPKWGHDQPLMGKASWPRRSDGTGWIMTRSSLERNLWGSNLSRENWTQCCELLAAAVAFFERSCVVHRRNDKEISPANLLHTWSLNSGYKESFDEAVSVRKHLTNGLIYLITIYCSKSF